MITVIYITYIFPKEKKFSLQIQVVRLLSAGPGPEGQMFCFILATRRINGLVLWTFNSLFIWPLITKLNIVTKVSTCVLLTFGTNDPHQEVCTAALFLHLQPGTSRGHYRAWQKAVKERVG